MVPISYLSIGPAETTLADDEAAAHAEFAATRGMVCRDALAPALLAKLNAACARAGFVSDPVEALGHREIERPALAGPAIALLLRRAPLFRWLERVTGCAPIADIEGRVVQTHAVAGDELLWHSDESDTHRRLAVTIALASPAYEGGLFELRSVESRDTLLRFKHDRPGTALIFDISPRYQHRVRPLTSGGPRRVFTGWFLG